MKYFISIIALLSIFLLNYSYAGKEIDKTNIQVYLDNGTSYLKSENYEKAIKEIEKAVEIAPSSVDAHYLLAYAYWSYGVAINREGDSQNLLDAFLEKEVEHRYEPEKRGYYKKSQVYLKKSAEQYKIIITIDPTHWMAQQMVAGHHLSNKMYDEAIEGYKLSIKYNDKYAYSYSGLARAYHNKGLFKLAEVNHKKALELEPNFEHGHYELGETYLASGQTQKALEILDFLKKAGSTFHDDFKRKIALHSKQHSK